MSVCISAAPVGLAARPRAAAPTIRIPASAVLAVLGALLLFAALTAMRPVPIVLTLDGAGAPSGVSLIDARIERSHGYVSVIGQTRNGSQRALRGAGVLVELLDRDGHLCGVESALLEAGAVRPGQSAPYRVYMPDEGSAVSARVTFRQIVPGN
jgi:hypothetical protein